MKKTKCYLKGIASKHELLSMDSSRDRGITNST